MSETFNIYCDESCHLPNDGNSVMVLGGVWCPKNKTRKINDDIRNIKRKYNIGTEMKWVKISEAKKQAYFDLIEYFFKQDDLHFRVLVVDNKNAINHAIYHQTHDDWYYKMYFNMIKVILNPSDTYNIYLDIKDTKSKTKIRKLQEVLSNNMYDFSGQVIANMQVIRSHEVEIMQITDILIGAVAYVSRNLNGVIAKNEVIDLIRKRSGYSLSKNTLLRENKLNVFHLQLSEGGNWDVL